MFGVEEQEHSERERIGNPSPRQSLTIGKNFDILPMLF